MGFESRRVNNGILSRRRLLGTAGLTAALALVGCSKSTSPSGAEVAAKRPSNVPSAPTTAKGSTTLTAWTWSAPGDLKKAYEAVKAAYPAEFKNVDINVQTVGTGPDDVQSKLTLALSSHAVLPDFVKLDYPQIPLLIESDVLADFSEFVTTDVEHDLLAGAVAGMTYKGKYYAVVHGIQGKVFWYRNDLFREAGIDPSEIQTMDEYITAGRKFTKKFPGRFITNIGDSSGVIDNFDMIASAYEDVEFAKDGYAFKEPVIGKAFQFWREVRESGIGYPTDSFSTDWAPALQKEKICGMLYPTWMTAFFPDYATISQKGKWSSVLWPSFSAKYGDQSYGGDLGADVFVVPKGAPSRDIALSFLSKARLEEKGVKATFESSIWYPPLRSLQDWMVTAVERSTRPAGMSAHDWALRPQQYFGSDVFKTASAAFDRVRVVDYGVNYEKEASILGPWMTKAVNGKISVDAALAGMGDDMRSQIH